MYFIFDQTKPSVDSSEAQQKEEDELQLALALSLSQEEANKVCTWYFVI